MADSGRLFALLGEVAMSANLALGPDEALEEALERICENLSWPYGQIFLVQDGRLELTDAWRGSGPGAESFRASSASTEFVRGTGLPGRVLETRLPAWIVDVPSDPDFPRAGAAVAAGFHSGCAFPVLLGGEVVAVLEFFASDQLDPGPVLLDAMRMVGIQLGRVFERRQVEVESVQAQERTRQILNTSGDAFVAMDAAGEIVEWNEQATQMFGWTRDEAIGCSVGELIVPPSFRDAHRAGLERFLRTGQAVVLGQRLELPALHREGHEFPIELTLWALEGADGTWGFYTFARDITERRAAAERLEHQALHDDLTGLANRALLIDRLTQSLARMARGGVGPAVLFVDLDGFKLINDSFGHHVGDRLLCTVAERLSSVLRPTDTLSRPAGDEFVVLLEEVGQVADAAHVAQRIGEVLDAPVELDGERVYVRASVGVALGTDSTTAEGLLADADAAMYRAKGEGRGRFELFGEEMRSRASSRLQLEAELREALEHPGELELHYQPVVSLTDLRSVGTEGLIRWNHQERGLLAPGAFIDLAEQSGLIVPIGAWVIAEAAAQARRWEEEGLTLNMAINLSARQLAQADFVDMVSRQLDDVGVDPSRLQLCLEITESILMDDPETSATVLGNLRQLGFRLAIDDFGTGYSSLAYLRSFPVDTVKLDQSFIRDIHQNDTDRTIVSSVIDLSHALGLNVVAEGVEQESQLRCLQDLGCDLAQGYLFARPAPAAEIGSAIRRGPLGSVAARG